MDFLWLFSLSSIFQCVNVRLSYMLLNALTRPDCCRKYSLKIRWYRHSEDCEIDMWFICFVASCVFANTELIGRCLWVILSQVWILLAGEQYTQRKSLPLNLLICRSRQSRRLGLSLHLRCHLHTSIYQSDMVLRSDAWTFCPRRAKTYILELCNLCPKFPHNTVQNFAHFSQTPTSSKRLLSCCDKPAPVFTWLTDIAAVNIFQKYKPLLCIYRSFH